MERLPDPASTLDPKRRDVVRRENDPRRRHYQEFYGLAPAPPRAGIVLGNCQAESLRIVIDGAAGPTVRVPPVHELEPDDVPHLYRLLADAAFVVAQPVHDGYRDLPVGTAQVRTAVSADCTVVTVPNVRFAGLHPFQAALHVPGFGDPPVVAYHDVRTLAAAAGDPVRETLDPAAVRAIAEDSRDELRLRETRNATDVRASDLFDRPDFDLMRTVNHAGNPVWAAIGRRVLRALGSDAAAVDPGRELLSAVRAPQEAWVADAWGLDDVREHWIVSGRDVTVDEVREAQSQWYAANPAVVSAAVARLAPTLARWAAA